MDIFKRAEKFAEFIGLELKGAIAARGYTAKEIAEVTKHSPAAFNRWLNGKTPIPVTVVCEVCEVLRVEPDKIVGWAYDRLAVAYGEVGDLRPVDPEGTERALSEQPGMLLESPGEPPSADAEVIRLPDRTHAKESRSPHEPRPEE